MPEEIESLEPKYVTLHEETSEGAVTYPKTVIAQVEGLEAALAEKDEKLDTYTLDLNKISEIEDAIEENTMTNELEAASIVLDGKTEAALIADIRAGKNFKVIGHYVDKKGKDHDYSLNVLEKKSGNKAKLKATAVLSGNAIAMVELTTKSQETVFDRTGKEDFKFSKYDSKEEAPKALNIPENDGVYGLKVRIVDGKPTFSWIKELSFFNITAGFIPSPTQEEINQSVLAGALTAVELTDDTITVKGHLEDIVEHLSSDPQQQDAPHKWFGLEINTGFDTLIGTHYGSYAFTAEDEAEATEVGCSAGSFVIYLRADVIVETPTTITLKRDGYEDKVLTVTFVEDTSSEEPAAE